nr:hypothetical protein [Fibrobacteria bacterium]
AAVCRIRVRRTDLPSPSSIAVDGTIGSPPSTPAANVSGGISGRGIHVVRYRLKKNENLGLVAQRFYGNKGLDWILIRWNGYRISAEWRNLPQGSVVEVPFWDGFEWGTLDPELAMKAIPWDEVRTKEHAR